LNDKGVQRFKIWFYAQPRAIRTLLTINVVVYFVWQLVLIWIGPAQEFVWRHLALNPTIPNILYEPWQLFSYGFLHLQPGLGGFLHILFNMLWFVWIGREYEVMHGAHRILALYLIGSIGGALLTVLLHWLLPGIDAFGGIVHGASASVLCIMTAIGIQYPQKSIALLFIGVVRLIHVVIGFLVLDFLFLAAGGTSVSAHLGGAFMGLLWAKAYMAGIDLSAWARIFFPSRVGGHREGALRRMESWFEKKSTKPRDSATIYKMKAEQGEASDDRARNAHPDVDEILDKISEKGYDALTAREKSILYEASKDD